jgi:mannitol 2-dehydrogenase
MKLRLLNGSHQALAYFAYLCGYRLVHEAAQDPLFQPFVIAYTSTLASLHQRGARPTLTSLV